MMKKEKKEKNSTNIQKTTSSETATGIDYSEKCPGMSIYSPYSGRKKIE
jgi:hypothetical protein